jgi:hypothetical protein
VRLTEGRLAASWPTGHRGGITGARTTLDLLSLPEGQLVADGSNNDSVALSGWSAITQQYNQAIYLLFHSFSGYF